MKQGLRRHHLVGHTVNRQDISSRGKISPDDGCIPTRIFTQVLCCNSRDYVPSRDGDLPIKVTVFVQLVRWSVTYRKSKRIGQGNRSYLRTL